jgi:uncharacterized membrane protein
MAELDIFSITLMLATLFTALVAGLVFTFAIVTMPGIKSLDDREFIRAFQVMDGVIQNNQPLFVLIWAGSVVALLVAAVLGLGELAGAEQWLLVGAAVVYLLGVQLPTIIINVPLNNQLQSLEVDAMDEAALSQARQDFESRWNQWNVIRTGVAVVVSVVLMLVLTAL